MCKDPVSNLARQGGVYMRTEVINCVCTVNGAYQETVDVYRMPHYKKPVATKPEQPRQRG